MERLLRSDFLLPTLWTGWRKWVVFATCAVFIYLLGEIRRATDAELAFASLALLPVLVIAWIGGRWPGLLMAILAAFMWSVADIYSGRTFSAQWVPLVNGLVRCFTYALVVLLASEVRMLLERLREYATVDSLTGLLNRGEFLRAGSVEVERARRYHSQLAVVFLDLDNFKALNDKNGHHVGDMALQATGKAMLESTRQSDYVSRLGGDEFAVVFPAIDFDSAVAAGNKLFKNVNSALDPYPPVRASIGIAWFQDADQEFEAMLEAADEIMYAVKANGKNNLLVRSYPEATKTLVGSDG